MFWLIVLHIAETWTLMIAAPCTKICWLYAQVLYFLLTTVFDRFVVNYVCNKTVKNCRKQRKKWNVDPINYCDFMAVSVEGIDSSNSHTIHRINFGENCLDFPAIEK